MRARAAAYPLWKRGNEMDQTIAFLGGDARMRLLAQMMAAEGYDVCSWELTGAPKPLALCDALKADIIVLPLPAEKNGYLSGTELTMESRCARCGASTAFSRAMWETTRQRSRSRWGLRSRTTLPRKN